MAEEGGDPDQWKSGVDLGIILKQLIMWYELRSPFVERVAVSAEARGLEMEELLPANEEFSYPYQVSMEGKEVFSNEVLSQS
jgi:hypothetical protein